MLITVSPVSQKHGKLIPLKCDVTSREDLLSVVQTIKEQQGYVNAVFANSGVLYNSAAPPDPKDDIKAFQSKLWDAGTPEEFTKTFEVNATAVYYTAVAFLELLDEGNKRATAAGEPTSQVIITSSIGGFRRDSGVFSISYGSSKAAATHMGKTLANTFKDWKIRVNVIAPGLYPSGTSTHYIFLKHRSDMRTNRDVTIPYQQCSGHTLESSSSGTNGTDRRYGWLSDFPLQQGWGICIWYRASNRWWAPWSFRLDVLKAQIWTSKTSSCAIIDCCWCTPSQIFM